MVSEIFQSMSLGFHISNFLAKLNIYIYHTQKSEQSLKWLVRKSRDKILTVFGTPVGQP